MTKLESFLKNTADVKVIAVDNQATNYFPIDLSIKNTNLSSIDADDSIELEHFINKYVSQNNAKVAYGGYNEERNLYKRSTIFNDLKVKERNIHIGLDLWIKAGTPVLAALEGKIHSFNYNAGLGNYGPTIILEHDINTNKFYTLYGHLSAESIQNIAIGTIVKKGACIAKLGDASINGNYAPHLHFQVIEIMDDYNGDYPGVCSKEDLPYYLKNCPNPNLLLKLK